MEASKGSIQYDSNGVEDRSLICQSSRKLKPSYKKYIGVQRCKSGRFYAFINDPITKKRRSLGTYDTAEQAASAYDFAAEVMRGTKAKTNLITFNPFKLTPSGAPTLSGSAAFSPPFSSKHSNLSSSPLNKPFNPSFLSKPSNPDNPFSSSLFNKPSQKQDNQVLHFGGSSTMLSSPWHKFRATNQDISASEHPVSTNDFTLPCSVPYTQSFQVPSSPMASTLNKSTSAVPETISTTQSLPNPVFPSIHRFLPNVDELASTPQSQQCGTNTLSPCTTIPSTSIHSTSGLVNLGMQNQCLYGNQKEQQFSWQYDTEKELRSTHLPGFEWSTDSQLCSLPQSPQCNTAIQCTTGLSNLIMQRGFYENQSEQQCTKQDDLEKLLQYEIEELSSTQSPDLSEWSTELSGMPSNADLQSNTDLCKWSTELLDFLLEDIPDVSTLPSLEGILD